MLAFLVLFFSCVVPLFAEDEAPPRKVKDATIVTIAGTGNDKNNGDSGQATEINVGLPFGVELGPDGQLYICEVTNHRVFRLDLKTGRIATVAGQGSKGYAGDGGPATAALLNEPYEVRFDSQGDMYFVEMQNHLIRKVDMRTGRISTVAGTGKAGFGGDGGPAEKALFSSPHSIALDAQDRIYVADIVNHRIRRIDPKTGLIETVAGNGEKTLPKDGAKARGGPILGPRALTIDGETLWIALREGNSVWKMNLRSEILTHVSGTGKKGFSGDGGDAKLATYDGPKGIALDTAGNVYVVDTENQVIRKIDADRGRVDLKTIKTVAGVGPKNRGDAGDGGKATTARLNRPHGICVGKDGTIYIGDSENHRVRAVRP